MLHAFLAPYAEAAYAALRIVAGLTFSFHGMQKILGILSDTQPAFGTQLWFAGVIELVGGLLIAVGLWTTWAAFVASGEMAVAYFQVHWKFSFDEQFFPIVNGGELAVVYCFLFLYIACRGTGRASLGASRRGGVAQPSA